MSSSGRGLCFPLVKACVFGNEPKAPDEVLLAPRTETAESTPSWQVLKLVFCASGLQVRIQAPLLFPSWVQTAPDLNQIFPAHPKGLLVWVWFVSLQDTAQS